MDMEKFISKEYCTNSGISGILINALKIIEMELTNGSIQQCILKPFSFFALLLDVIVFGLSFILQSSQQLSGNHINN